jgi:hypothetical protein
MDVQLPVVVKFLRTKPALKYLLLVMHVRDVFLQRAIRALQQYTTDWTNATRRIRRFVHVDFPLVGLVRFVLLVFPR